MKSIIAVLAVTAIVVSGLIAMSVSPARAQGPPFCYTMEKFQSDVVAAGDIVAGAATYNGALTITLIVVESANGIALFGFSDGCLIAGPIYTEPRGPAVKPTGQGVSLRLTARDVAHQTLPLGAL